MNTHASPAASPSRAIADLTILLVIVAIGAAVGEYAAHVFVAAHPYGSPAVTAAQRLQVAEFYAVMPYIGAAGLVGFGLVNRMLRSTVIRVPLGGIVSLLLMFALSLVVGLVATPFVVLWRVFAVSRSIGPRHIKSERRFTLAPGASVA